MQGVDSVLALDVNGQSTSFLERYLFEFQTSFEEVLDLAEDFKKKSSGSLFVSEENFCALAQEHSLGAARSRTGMKGTADQASFFELCLTIYKKSVHDFLNPPKDEGVSAEDALKLKKAIEDYQRIMEEIAAKERKIAALQAMVSAGGVKGLKAKAELEQLRSQDKTEQNRRAIKGAAAQRQAQKVVSRNSMGSSSSLQADAIKARILASISERMAKLAKQEQERANALAAQFDGAFEEAPAMEDEPLNETEDTIMSVLLEEECEELASANSNNEQELRAQEEAARQEREREEAERERVEEEKRRAEAEKREEEKRVQAEIQRKKAQAEQEERAERERAERAAREEAEQREAEEMERRKIEAAKALEDARNAEIARIAEAEEAARKQAEEERARAQSAAEAAEAEERRKAAAALLEEQRRKEEERIAELQRAAEIAEKEAKAKQAAAEEERKLGPIKDFSAWNANGINFAEAEARSLQFCFRPGKWLDAMKLAASKKQESTVQSLRRVVLNGTLQAIEKGSYELETEEDPVKKLGCNMPLLKINKVSLPLDLNVVSASIAGAVLYPSTHVWPKSTADIRGTAHFLQGDCIDVAVWLQTTRGVRPVVVLSVDPKGNGGDFEKGSCSQEEEVWRRTTYSAVAGATQFLPLSGSAVRYVPSVQLLRQGEVAGYAFSTAPVVLAFIAASAVHAPVLNMMGKYSDDDTARIKNTIRAMFGCAMQHGHDAIVIPAWGCGFNKNDPAIVAALFHDVLVSEYPKSFKHVTFAIQNDVNGPSNFETFQAAYVNRAKQLAKAKAERKARAAKK